MLQVPHADQHANANDAIEALQAKVGSDSSEVPTSLDYRVTQLESDPPAHTHDDRYYTEAEVDALISGVTPAWGSISGTLADQADLQAALDLKANTADLNTSNWDTAYSWGDHSLAGYVSGTPWTLEGYLTSENDPVFTAWLATVSPANWDTAYGWGDHSLAGYLTSVAFADLTDYPADSAGVLTNDGAGNLSWGAGGGGTPGGSDTQLQFNNSGAFAGITGWTSDGATLAGTTDFSVTGTSFNPLFQVDVSEDKVWIGNDRTLSNQGVFNMSFTPPSDTTGAAGTVGKKGWNFYSQRGGNVSSAGTDFFGNGGAAGGGSFSTNAGGNVTGSYLFLTIAGKGGDLSFATGAGGVTSATSGYGSTSGAGGDMSFTLGNGGGVSVSNASANTGGIGGSSSFYAGNGGAATGSSSSNIGGAGGSLLFRGGYGGNTSGAGSVGGNGGNVTFQTGKAGSGTTSGQGGSVYFNYTTSGGSAVTILTLKDGYCLVNDNIGFYFGTGKDASISYDGSNLNIFTRVVGSGNLRLRDGDFEVTAGQIRVSTSKTPASASATGTTGEICWDSNYIYVCTATNTWKRTAISTW